MRVAPPDLPGAQTTDSPIDRALALLLANETEAALRWAAATVERAPSMPSALVITCRLLEQMGRPEAAVEGFELSVRRAIDGANLPLAVAAIGDLRALGVDVRSHLDALASAFCLGSDRITETEAPPPPLPNFEGFQPLSSFLTGPALTSKATQIIHAAKRDYDDAAGSEILLTAPLPLFSAMPKEALRDLVGAFEMITVPAGHCVIEEGEEGSEAYIVARGELEVLRRSGDDDSKPPIMLARLVSGALFGEMALLSRAPRAASVVATRPSILLVAKREALEAVAEGRPEVAVELAAPHGRQPRADFAGARGGSAAGANDAR
jgi:Cyclic nucleotide-binding domain